MNISKGNIKIYCCKGNKHICLKLPENDLRTVAVKSMENLTSVFTEQFLLWKSQQFFTDSWK